LLRGRRLGRQSTQSTYWRKCCSAIIRLYRQSLIFARLGNYLHAGAGPRRSVVGRKMDSNRRSLSLCQWICLGRSNSRLLCGVRTGDCAKSAHGDSSGIDGTSFSSGKVSTEPGQLQSHAFELSSSAPNETSLANPQRYRRATGKSELAQINSQSASTRETLADIIKLVREPLAAHPKPRSVSCAGMSRSRGTPEKGRTTPVSGPAGRWPAQPGCARALNRCAIDR
jgi:hypothetical protein